jgi:hypothetical protein
MHNKTDVSIKARLTNILKLREYLICGSIEGDVVKLPEEVA